MPKPDAGDSHTVSQGGSTTILAGDAGAGTCKLLRPALMQPYSGPAVIRFVRVGGAEVAELVFNDGGHPQLSDAPLVSAAATREVAMPAKSTLPGCAVAGRAIYCPDANGAIHLTMAGDSDMVVAKSRPGTPLSAVSVGDGHRALAYLEENATSEGSVRQAKIMLDEGPALSLSEEGSGATAVALVARDDEVFALTLDARVAMTPTHVRKLRLEGDKLTFGRDAVVFVGGPGERRTSGALAIPKAGPAFALVAVGNSIDKFGLAAIHVSDPPTEDERVAWSFYPGGLDPAAIAATRGISPIRVARARPTSPGLDASQVLELGQLDGAGGFLPKCILSESAYVKDLELDVDAQGAMWIFWRDTRGSHFERRALP